MKAFFCVFDVVVTAAITGGYCPSQKFFLYPSLNNKIMFFAVPTSIADASQHKRPNTKSQCPKNDGMTDAQLSLSSNNFSSSLTNNYSGSSIARGLEDDGAGGKAPKAAKMLKMVYDCKVEASALKHARKCVFRHSTRTERRGLGENLFSTSAIKFDKVEAAKQVL
ncbi:hypothetical protein NECAME_01217 [Necator americanus]|uniref:SCP domain-containing protein n=1 Tax=Necator americanus TaxID=51031 RepID=W2TYB1_NECAM|nr:hypothetical protein NECAME_01217 [Necator americanus]ETN87060.1 hypothetical protein NECAME_01217 [Necator americanus]